MTDTNKNKQLKELFTTVYLKNSWESTESISGPGSHKDHPTITDFRNTIMHVCSMIKDNKLTIVDLPCGDCNFIFDILSYILHNHPSITNIEYYGYDIVEPLIDNLKSTIKPMDNVTINFIPFSIVETVIPIDVDIVLCKELFIHLSFNEINSALVNLNKSKFGYFIYGVDFTNASNTDITYSIPGECREITLTTEPFNCNNYIHQHNGYLVYKNAIN